MIADWLNPLSGLDLQNAVNARRKTVKLKVGPTDIVTDFTIKYEGPKFWLSPKDGLVPCGWFDINKVLERYA